MPGRMAIARPGVTPASAVRKIDPGPPQHDRFGLTRRCRRARAGDHRAAGVARDEPRRRGEVDQGDVDPTRADGWGQRDFDVVGAVRAACLADRAQHDMRQARARGVEGDELRAVQNVRRIALDRGHVDTVLRQLGLERLVWKRAGRDGAARGLYEDLRHGRQHVEVGVQRGKVSRRQAAAGWSRLWLALASLNVVAEDRVPRCRRRRPHHVHPIGARPVLPGHRRAPQSHLGGSLAEVRPLGQTQDTLKHHRSQPLPTRAYLLAHLGPEDLTSDSNVTDTVFCIGPASRKYAL
jgi:hypothetical protein